LGVFPVTNAEYALFVEAGGYEDERWWSTDADRAWLAGESSREGQKVGYRDLAQQLADMSDETIRAMLNFTPEQIEISLWLKHTEPAERERQLSEWFPEGEIYDRPAYWDDSRFNGPNQPVVGLSWFEARAYCAWLSAQSGDRYTLPAEAEWEAAARGRENRVYAYGDEYDPGRCNTFESHIRGTTPVGVYPSGYTPEGVADLSGNVWEWTNTIYQDYPYSADDGREDDQDGVARRVLRGGSWSLIRYPARAAARRSGLPYPRYHSYGFRLARRSPST
jgi:formylglycine-generating enzyme required for sulfatase activity